MSPRQMVEQVERDARVMAAAVRHLGWMLSERVRPCSLTFEHEGVEYVLNARDRAVFAAADGALVGIVERPTLGFVPAVEIETLELLASRYVGSKVDRTRTHAFELGAARSLCGRISIEGAAYGAGDVSEPPSCPKCYKHDPRFAAARYA